MQRFLSGYAIWAGRRWRRPGHLFQGRYRTEMIEDETYYWTVSRYIHLNPVRAGLVPRPEQWEWSSYPGYRDARKAQAWVAHDKLLAAWQGDHGGPDARADERTPDLWSAAWTVRPHRRFAMPLAGGFWAPSNSWLEYEASPVRSSPILRSRKHVSSAGSTRNGSSRPSGLSTAWTKPRCRGGMTPISPRCRRLALPPAHRSVTTRTRRVVGTVACRQRPQPHPPDRNAAESFPRTLQRSG